MRDELLIPKTQAEASDEFDEFSDGEQYLDEEPEDYGWVNGR